MFVGGVPKDLNKDDLFAIFSEYAEVKKAWLQKCRTATDQNGSTAAQPCSAQNHRGFGFVIFHHAHAVDTLLGNGASRFILLRNGAKLEVKRAFTNSKLGGSPWGRVDGAVQGHQPQASPTSTWTPSHGQQNLNSSFRRSDEHPQRMPTLSMPVPAPPCVAPLESVPWPGVLNGNALKQMLIPNRAPVMCSDHADIGSGATIPQLNGGMMCPSQTHVDNSGSTYHPGPPAPVCELASMVLPPSNGNNSHTAPAPGSGGGGRVRPVLRDAIVQFYHAHRPEKATERDFIDFICFVYEGREAELDKAFRQKYGTGLRLSGLQCTERQNPDAPRCHPDCHDAQKLMSAQSGAGAHHAPPSIAPGSCGDRLQHSSVDALKVGSTLNTASVGRDPSGYLVSTVHDSEGVSSSSADADSVQADHDAPDCSWVDKLLGDDFSNELPDALVS